jgi:hypothetical protein
MIYWRLKLISSPEAEEAPVNNINPSLVEGTLRGEDGSHSIVLPTHEEHLHHPPPNKSDNDHPMANFAVNSAPYAPDGLEVEK